MGGENLFNEHLTDIVQRLEYLEDVKSFSAVCKAWNSVASEWMEKEKPWLPTRNPWLLLAEDTGADLNAVVVGSLEAYSEDYEEDDDQGDEEGDDDEGETSNLICTYDEQMKREVDRTITSISDLFKNVSSFRGLFSLKTRKTYDLDLPEAIEKLILGTNKGCLVTLGRDLEINLLHPLLRYQIPLPHMLTFPSQYNYDDDFFPQQVYDMFITKVVMSSTIPTKSAFKHQDTSHLPIVMAIYGEHRILGFARLGDKCWQNVETSLRVFEDIVYHKEVFHAIDCHGSVFLCDIEKEQKGKIITSVPIEKEDMVQSYLIESLSGSHLWLVLRSRSGEYFKTGPEPFVPGELRYYTSNFIVFKLEVQYSNSNDDPTCHWTKVKDLGDEALFIGRSSSVSIASSKFVEPNSIYFTDDMSMYLCGEGGGHDMGVFNVKTSTIQPHYDSVSIHPYSSPVWYI